MSDSQGTEQNEDHNSDASFDEEFDEDVDPRVQGELESLNSASEDINKLETELEKARNKFRGRQAESSNKLHILHKKLGRCVTKCRPYYDLLKQSRKAQAEAQRAAVNFQRANSIYNAARETVSLAEKKITDTHTEEDKREFDAAWQEMLNHATIKFMESEHERKQSEEEHMKRSAEYSLVQARIRVLSKDQPHNIARSRPYFELKDKLEYVLQQERHCIDDLQRTLNAAKDRYKESLSKLEAISEEIHMQRKLRLKLPPRTPGVGAERDDDNSDLPSTSLDMQSETSSFVSMDDDANSSVLSSPENYPRDMLLHQRSVSHDWTGKPFPFSPVTSLVSPHHDIAKSPEPATTAATGPCRSCQGPEQLQAAQHSGEAQRVASLPPDGSSASSDCGSVTTMASDEVSFPDPAITTAKTPDVRQKQEQATVTIHEMSSKTQIELAANVPHKDLQSRVGTGISTQMSNLQLGQQQRQQATDASGKDSCQSSQSKSKDAASQPRASRSNARSRTPSQAFPILAGLSECNRQHSPKLSRAQMDTGASGYDASWHRVAGERSAMGHSVNNPMGQYPDVLRNTSLNG